MRLFQVLDAQGRLCPGALAGDCADVITPGQPGPASTLALLTAVDQDGLDLAAWLDERRRGGGTVTVNWPALERTGKADGYTLTIPIMPPEVWGAGVTYRRSADFREEGLGIYDRVYEAPRARAVLQGDGLALRRPAREPIGRRRDSALHRRRARARVVLVAPRRDPRLHARQRRLGLGHRARQPALPAAVEGLRRLLRVRAGDRDARRDPRSLRARAALPVTRGGREVFAGSASTGSSSAACRSSSTGCRASNDVRPAPCSRPAPASSSRSGRASSPGISSRSARPSSAR